MPKVALSYGHGANTYEDVRSKFVIVGGKVYEEHTFNATVGEKVRAILERHGVDVLVVQPPMGKDVPLQVRTDKADKWKADLYWSIHANAASPSARGLCAFYWKTSPDGKRAADLYAKFAKEYGFPLYSGGTYPSQRGDWTNFHELRETDMPAVITENGFMTNPDDFELIFKNKDGFYDSLSLIHAKAILAYLGIAYKAPAKPATVAPKKKFIFTTGTFTEGYPAIEDFEKFMKDKNFKYKKLEI
ncbi:N-acetylmuramoyl-L-alanine amidase family protein [Peribacillus sp. SCS-26]|uniref:N-acetylmuramoyl-L-alanine amidase family protein n=1 Tax=Paraperibacillus marinus TaxID=3115295 RepID=UPI003905AFEC